MSLSVSSVWWVRTRPEEPKTAANPLSNSLASMKSIPSSLPLALWGDLDQHLMNPFFHYLPSTANWRTQSSTSVFHFLWTLGPLVSLRLPSAHEAQESCQGRSNTQKKTRLWSHCLFRLNRLRLFSVESDLSKCWDMSMISKNAHNVLHAQVVRNYNFPPWKDYVKETWLATGGSLTLT